MEMYKIRATISHMSGGDAWNPYGEDKITSFKEYYHRTEDGALTHIYSYIRECADNGIVLLEVSGKKLDGNYKKWANGYIDRGHYEVTLNKINVLE